MNKPRQSHNFLNYSQNLVPNKVAPKLMFLTILSLGMQLTLSPSAPYSNPGAHSLWGQNCCSGLEGQKDTDIENGSPGQSHVNPDCQEDPNTLMLAMGKRRRGPGLRNEANSWAALKESKSRES